METKEDLQKLTVVQLREKLKGRNLATTGTKSELVERLYESFQEEENLLSGSGANDDLDVDDLLGTNLDEHSLTSKEEALLLGINPKQKTAEQKAAVQTPKKPVEPASTEKKTAEPAPAEKKPIEAAPVEKKTSDTVRPQITTDSNSKLAERAKRFGLPLGQTEQKPAEKKTSVTSDSGKHPVSITSNVKLAERAKRFGLPVQSSDDASNGASKAKIPRVSAGAADEAKQRRMERFGAK